MISPSLIIDNSKECDRLVIRDATIYDDEIESISLEIKAPGSCCFVPVSVLYGWCSKIITIDDTGIACGSSQCYSNLPDGIYEIKYTINGQEALYYHLRVCELWNTYISGLCELFDSKCETSPQLYKDKLDTFHSIRNTILDAITLAEDCLQTDKAIELYNTTEEKLKGNDCKC